jgi:tetratricopeptide (TPR) repeat protein
VAALQPDNPYVRVAIAGVLMRARQYDEARQEAALAVALAERRDARSRAVAHETAARIALALADADAAETHAAAVQAEDPAIPMPQFVRGRLLYESVQYGAALAAFQEALAVVAEHGRPLEDLQWHLGETLARLDRYTEAETHFREELRAFPRSIRSYSSLATLYRASNRDRDVEDVIGELTEAAPTPEGYGIAARLWTILGDRARADALRLEAQSRFRGDPALALLERIR